MNPAHTCRRNRCAYSMVEIMMVVAVLIVMITMLLPVMDRAKETAKYAICTSNLGQLYKAAMTDSVANGMPHMPSAGGWQASLEALVEEPRTMLCPMDVSSHFKIDENIEFLPDPPKSLKSGELESADKIHVFREREGYELEQDVEAVTEPGSYGIGGDTKSHENNGVITKGTKVDVFLFHYDPPTDAQPLPVTLNVGNDRILGYIGDGASLIATDRILGLAPEVVYWHKIGRRVEKSELIEFNRSTLHYRSGLANSFGIDEIRLITSPGAASSYGMNKEAEGVVVNDNQILFADTSTPIIDFDGIGADSKFEDTISPRHHGKVNVVFLDGSVQLLNPEELTSDSPLWRRR